MRARAGATVSVPLQWEELTDDLQPAAFTVKNAAERLSLPDPWAGFTTTRPSITAAMRRTLGMGAQKD
jgi:bifunctional non-homologous end joining protein LigD